MLRTFQMQVSLPKEKSYDLFFKSGSQINSWRANKSDPKSGYIEWKQSFWAFTGTSVIAVQLEQVKENTSVTVSVHKPLQVFDPLGISEKIVNKLVKSLESTISQDAEYQGCIIKFL